MDGSQYTFSPVKKESAPGASMTSAERDPRFSSQSTTPLKVEDEEDHRVSPEAASSAASSGSKVTAVAVVAPTNHQVNG